MKDSQSNTQHFRIRHELISANETRVLGGDKRFTTAAPRQDQMELNLFTEMHAVNYVQAPATIGS
jgi:hypothetical protein